MGNHYLNNNFATSALTVPQGKTFTKHYNTKNKEMVEARNFGSDGFVVNHIDAGEYSGGSDLLAAALKAKRGGVGGRGSKAHNHKEAKVANRRRNEKREREEK